MSDNAFDPDRAFDPAAALMAQPGWRREKLQVLRWLAHDARPATPPVRAALAQALADADWELRATAMLVAARLRVTPLAASIAGLVLPQRPGEGVTDTEYRLLLALRDAALERLGSSRERRLPPGVAAALGGDLSGLVPGLAMFVHALTVPLPDAPPEPAAVAGVVSGSEGPRLSDGRWLAWVPPVEHWLGDDGLAPGVSNPARRHRPTHGFYIDAEPRPPGSPAQAVDEAAQLSARLGCSVAPASSDEWEMAARGPDGRRFPWGMNAEPAVRSDLSPWNVAGTARGGGEWVVSGDSLAAGGAKSINMAARRRVAPGTALGYRFVFR